MRKMIIIGAIAAVSLLSRRAARGCGQFSFERMIERMPDDAPPKWMFQNISAIRANTEQILERLPAEQTAMTKSREHTFA